MVFNSLLCNRYYRMVVIKMKKNMVIHHRNMIDITNHIDKDGDLEPNYVILRNTGLTGNEERMNWLIECATKGCPICAGIFEPNKSTWKVKEWYITNVVNPQLKLKRKREKEKREFLAKPNTQVNAFAQILERSRKERQQIKTDSEQHPLYEQILKTFRKGE